MLEHEDEAKSAAEELTLSALDRLLEVRGRWPEDWLVVSSEVGLSPVPPNALGRRFQDLLGLVNQKAASAADRVYLVVAGLPVPVKGPTMG